MPDQTDALRQRSLEFVMMLCNESTTARDLSWAGVSAILEAYAITANAAGAQKAIERLRKLES